MQRVEEPVAAQMPAGALPSGEEATVDLTVILPAYNEAENLAVVVPRVDAMLDALEASYEIVVVDDGSNDGTRGLALQLQARHPNLRYVRLRRNFGKSTALQTGFDLARGATVVLMDADGQDRPEEVPKLLAALDGGLDLVTGHRVLRDDRFVKRHTSRLYNRVTARVSGVEGSDFNSGLKAMRRDVIGSFSLYGELHRYIPVLATWAGFRVGEVPVEHSARLHGKTKFGRARFWRGFLDLLTVKFITTYTARPFHLFGGLGAVLGLAGGALLAWMLVLRIMGERVGDRPALLAGVLLVMVGIQLMSLGLIGELIVHVRRDRGTTVSVESDRGEGG